MEDLYGIKEFPRETPEGWDALVDAMADELTQQLSAEGVDPADYEVVQIKEKFGEIRYYDSSHSDAVDDIIEKYAKLSGCTCANCGAPAEYMSIGYFLPFCGKCKRKLGREGRIQFRALTQEEKEDCEVC